MKTTLSSIFLALLSATAMAAPRGLIVQVGGVCPEPSEGRVIHYRKREHCVIPFQGSRVLWWAFNRSSES